jgi:8-oxo-dGTP pyrophosphatase MutT (NUDIX family)
MPREEIVLADSGWQQLRVINHPEAGVENYSYCRESKAGGKGVAVLPFRWKKNSLHALEFLIRSEFNPPWSTEENFWTCVTGMVDPGEVPDHAAIRELLEETGYDAPWEQFVPLGWMFSNKGSDTITHMYGVDLTGLEAGDITGDGSLHEQKAFNQWVDEREMFEKVQHALVLALYAKLKAA